MGRGAQATEMSGVSVLALVLFLVAAVLMTSVALRDWTAPTPRHAASDRWDAPADVVEPASWEVLDHPITPCVAPRRVAACLR